MQSYLGFRTFTVDGKLIDSLYSNGNIEIWDKRHALFPNMYVELRNSCNEQHTALGRVDSTGLYIEKIVERKASGISPKNREQVFALDALMNKDIPVVALTGNAGTGKSFLALAAALEQMQNKLFDKVILSRPMSEVGKYKLGALPGDETQKFGPYLLNYTTNLEQLVGDRRIVDDLMEQSKFEIVPLQLFRGASFNKCLVLMDEVQSVGHYEILTIGTRIGHNSKIVIMGDLSQRDEKIAKDKTGLFKLVNDQKAKESPLVASIQLQRCERSPTARLFAEIFEE